MTRNSKVYACEDWCKRAHPSSLVIAMNVGDDGNVTKQSRRHQKSMRKEGMVCNKTLHHASLALFLGIILAAYSTGAFAASLAASVKTLRGSATATSADGITRELQKGSEVFVGDTVVTGTRSGSFILLQFHDQSQFAIGRNGKLKVSDFIYQKSEQTDRIATRILKGAFRFVSGLIAKRKPRSMEVFLSVATIGIRGTEVGGEVNDESATVILLEPEKQNDGSVIEVSNSFGSVTIDQPGWGTDIPDANSPPSPPRRMRLRTIDNLTRSLRSIGRIFTPRPRIR